MSTADAAEEVKRLEAQLIDARRRVVELEVELRRLHTEQVRLIKRFCDALGQWSGPWDEAALSRLRAARHD